MRGFVVTTLEYIPMAQEAAARAVKYGGLTDVQIYPVSSKSDCHREKLGKFLNYNEPVWLIDADWWMVRECALPECRGSVIVGAPNNNPSTIVDVDKSMALCSCLISLDTGNEVCRKVIRDAIERQTKAYPSGEIKADEKFLVEAALTCSQITVCRLSTNFNWCGDNPPKEVVAVHAADRKDKLEWLARQVGIEPT